MTNQSSSEKFLVMDKTKLKQVDVPLECSINLESTQAVERVLTVNVSAEKLTTESLLKEANVSGILAVDLIYLTQDGNVYTNKYTSPFSCKVTDDKIDTNSKIKIKVVSAKGEVSSIHTSLAKVNCLVSLDGYLYNNNEMSYLYNENSDVCTQSEDISVIKMSDVQNSSWTESMEVEVKEPTSKVLYTNTNAFVKDYEIGTNYVSVTCNLDSEIVYLTDEEVPQIKTAHKTSEVKQEIEFSGISKENTCEVSVMVANSDVKTTIENVEKDIKLSLSIPLDVSIVAFETQNLNVVCDLFSVTKNVAITSSSYQSTSFCEPIVFDKKVEGSLTLSENDAPIDKLLAVNYSKVIVTNEYFDMGTYNVGGVIQTNLVYFSEDEARVCSLDVEFPFIISTQTDYTSDYLTDLDIQVCDVDVMVKRGKDVYIDAVVKVRTNVCVASQGAVITDVTYLDDLPQKDCAIEIYFAKAGEKVWDIAKKLCVMPEVLYAQNQDLTEVLEKDEKLAIYYQLNN